MFTNQLASLSYKICEEKNIDLKWIKTEACQENLNRRKLLLRRKDMSEI